MSGFLDAGWRHRGLAQSGSPADGSLAVVAGSKSTGIGARANSWRTRVEFDSYPEELPMSEPKADHILQVGTGFWASKVLLSAVEMGLFTELAQHPEDLETLQGRLGLHRRSARDFLDALVALKFLQRTDGKYSNTESTDFFLDKRKPSYIGGILEMANHRLYPFWGHLTTALRTGLPQNEAKDGGPDPFAALYADPARLKEFLRAMTGVSHGANMAIARKFPWGRYRTAVDIGTAQGDLITQVALANPHLSGIGFDLPAVAPIFEEYVEANGLAGRVKFCSGKFFRPAVAQGRCSHDGPHPARLGSGHKAHADPQSLGGIAAGRRLHRV